MRDTSRRHFLRAAATSTTVAALGMSVGASSGLGRSQGGDVPAYADWVPADDVILGERGDVFVSSFDVTAMLEAFAEDDQEDQEQEESDEPDPLPFEAFATNALIAVFDWANIEQRGLAEPILGQSTQSATNNPESTDVPSDRQTVIGDTSIYTGSFDTNQIATIIEESDFEETDTAGIFGIEPDLGQAQYIAWDEEWVVSSSNRGEIEPIIAAGTGSAPRRYEQDSDLRQLFASGGTGDFAVVRRTEEESLTFQQQDAEFFNIDYSPLEGAQGYAHSNRVDLDAEVLDAVTVVSYATEGAVDMGRLEAVASNASDFSSGRRGRFVTIETTYEGDDFIGNTGSSEDSDSTDGTDDGDGTDEGSDSTDGGSTDEGSGDDGSDTTDSSDDDSGNDGGDDSGSGSTEDDSTDGGSGDDGGETDGGNGEDDAESSDDGGAGFGVVAALSGLGGTGYMLKRRLGPESE